jgi:hypothetical protein
MIPLNMLPWRLIGKIAGALVVAACLAWIFIVLKSWHDDSQALPAVEDARDAAIAETDRVRADLSSEVTRLQTVNEGLINERNLLQEQRAAVPVRTVRLCRPAQEAAAVASDPAGAGGNDAAAAGPGPLQEEGRWDPEPGPDIGPALYALFDEADDMLAKYRALQGYVRGLPRACTTD